MGDGPASDLLVATSRDDGVERPDARVLTDGKSALVRGPHLTGVDNIEPGCADHTTHRWSGLPRCRLPLRQELHKLGTPADSLLVGTEAVSQRSSGQAAGSAGW
jgi:hypothetical protein